MKIHLKTKKKVRKFQHQISFQNRKIVIEEKYAEWRYLLRPSLVEYGNYQVLNPM